MTDILQHRGPDDRGTYISETHPDVGRASSCGVALGHRRLSIIDLSGGHQPMSNQDGSVWVVFNGEIYNYLELRARLESRGFVFRTNSDTEALLHLYEDEGVEFLRHLNGMFALAIWDNRSQELLMARDRLGQKPLVYREEPGRLLFASELKSLLQVPDIPRDIDPIALDEYLTYQYIPHPRTIFRGISKLPPAHYALYRRGQLTIQSYWRPDLNHELHLPRTEYQHRLREVMTSAVKLRLQSEVPLGAFLSGGIDSSIIVALMQQLSSQPVKTFSIGFPVAEYDESSHARMVARHVGTQHEEFHIEPDAVEVLPTLVWHYDEPFGDSSAIPTYYVSKMTRKHVTVALTGDGGDELFAGYRRHRAMRISGMLDRFPGVRSAVAAGPWHRLPDSVRQKSNRRRIKKFLTALGQTPQRRFLTWIAIFEDQQRAELYDDQFRSQLDGHDPIEFIAQEFARCDRRDPVSASCLTDLMTYLPCDLMTKTDIASMSVSLEARSPFLDYRVVEMAAAMPSKLKLRGQIGKRILQETFDDLVPSSVFRRRKMGFSVPLDHWFGHELKQFAQDVLFDSRTLERGYFQCETVQRYFDEHQAKVMDHSQRLWSLLFLELWHRQWVDAPVGVR
jgi:asparagine synthase (glutamine-hydrolysing)